MQSLTGNFASQEKVDEISSFFSENSFPGTERTVQQSLETIQLNEAWLTRDSEEIKHFLNNSSHV